MGLMAQFYVGKRAISKRDQRAIRKFAVLSWCFATGTCVANVRAT
jgi:hypothetical protein